MFDPEHILFEALESKNITCFESELNEFDAFYIFGCFVPEQILLDALDFVKHFSF